MHSDLERAIVAFRENNSKTQVRHEEGQVLKPEEVVKGGKYWIKRVEDGQVKVDEGLEVTFVEGVKFKARHFTRENPEKKDDAFNSGLLYMSSYGIVPREIKNPETGKNEMVYSARTYLVKV